jgi:hypothetical protein
MPGFGGIASRDSVLGASQVSSRAVIIYRHLGLAKCLRSVRCTRPFGASLRPELHPAIRILSIGAGQYSTRSLPLSKDGEGSKAGAPGGKYRTRSRLAHPSCRTITAAIRYLIRENPKSSETGEEGEIHISFPPESGSLSRSEYDSVH